VLFLDEPTTGLDPASRATVWEQIARLRRELGVTIFLTTQYLEEADALADRVAIMDSGLIQAEGTPTDLKRQIGADLIIVRLADERAAEAAAALEGTTGVSKLEARGSELTVVTDTGAATLSPVAVALAATDLDVVDISLRQPTLDDVFLSLTGRHMQVEDSPAEASTS